MQGIHYVRVMPEDDDEKVRCHVTLFDAHRVIRPLVGDWSGLEEHFPVKEQVTHDL